MLCETCKSLFRGPLGQGRELARDAFEYTLNHHKEITELREAALRGCFICHEIWGKGVDIWPMATDLAVDFMLRMPKGQTDAWAWLNSIYTITMKDGEKLSTRTIVCLRRTDGNMKHLYSPGSSI
jgi:hypothetical protein